MAMKKELILVGGVIAGLVAGLTVLFLNVSFLPPLASEQGEFIDNTLRLLFAIAAGILVLIVVFLAYSVIRFRRRPGDAADGPPIQSNPWLLAAFFFIPAALVLWSAVFGAVELRDIRRAPAATQEELEVQVTAFRWAWRFQYPESGKKTTELIVPLGRPVLFKITSLDVLHAFWVTEWRPKVDALPGVETELRITPNRLGDYQVRCAELCGFGHTFMLAAVKVVTQEEFEATGWGQQTCGAPGPHSCSHSA